MVDWTPIYGLLGNFGSVGQYIGVHRVFSLVPLVGPVTHFINAPFGRFSLQDSRLNVNGNIGWFLMEIVSPITFTMTLLGSMLDTAPMSLAAALELGKSATAKLSNLTTPTKILASLFVIHYINRSTISSLRTPAKRSPMHISVPLSAVFFNLCNGYLMGSWLGGRTSPWTSKTGAIPEIALQSKLFWFGLLLWGLGFLGNLYSDEVLYNLRRPGPDGKPKPRYSIPHGFLYSWPFGGVSFPAYFCEWIEWTGFAIAAVAHSPAPALPSLLPSNPAALAAETAGKIVGQAGMLSDVSNRLLNSSAYITPPFLFLYAEIATMLPRAYKGHLWYKEKFGKDFPKDRKIVIPGVL